MSWQPGMLLKPSMKLVLLSTQTIFIIKKIIHIYIYPED